MLFSTEHKVLTNADEKGRSYSASGRFKITNVNVKVVQEEKSEDHEGQQASFAGDHDCPSRSLAMKAKGLTENL